MARLNRCGCCDAGPRPTPEEVWNRPGLSAIRYRVGTFTSFRRAMLAAISDHPELREWTTRSGDDYGIALLSMWAYVGDILTFYNERIANEAYLGTAVLRESAMRLAALLDYQPDPGVAATAWLSFNAEKDKEVRIPLGLRVQSVPGQDEKPQKFETVQPVHAQARLNRVRAFPEPQAASPLAANSTQALLEPGALPDLAPGEKLVVRLATTVQEKQVEALETRDGWTFLRWSPAVQGAGAVAMYKWLRKMRVFGHNAPASFIRATTNGTSTITWNTVNAGDAGYTFTLNAASTLALDAVYDLAQGTWLLIVGPGIADLRRADTVVQAAASKGPLSAAVTQVTLNAAMSAVNVDLRQVTVYQLVDLRPGDPAVPLWNRRFAETVTGSTVYLPLDQADAIDAGRALILDDAAGQPQVVMTTAPAAAADTDGDGIFDHLAVPFTPPLARPLDTWSAFVLGNIALSTHGEKVVNEVLGNGDASRTFQTFKLKKAPVTHVPDPKAPHGAASTLVVRVDGIRWHEVRSLFGQGPDDRVYVTRIDEDGVMTVQFGDGETGARLTTGRNNVTANYRHGLGLAGRVRAHTLTVPLDRPVGLKGSDNPAAAEGGAEAEPLEAIRDNAPNTVRTFDRVISLRDFEDAAREFAGVAKARAAWKWDGEERVVQLTVAGNGDAELGPTALGNLRAYLDARRDPHRRMTVASYEKVFVEIELRIEPDPDHDAEKVQKAVVQALEGFFAFDEVELGQPVQLSDVYSVVQGVDGVVAADLDRLMFKGPFTLGDLLKRAVRFTLAVPDAVQPRLLLFPHELARIETPSTDLVVHLGIHT